MDVIWRPEINEGDRKRDQVNKDADVDRNTAQLENRLDGREGSFWG